MTLLTERLVLRRPVESDAPALREYYLRNDERFARWREARSHDIEEHLRRLGAAVDAHAGTDVTLAAFAHGTSAVVALVRLTSFSAEDPPQASISYTVDGIYEGRGYAREAVRRVIEYARNELRLGALNAHYEPGNARSDRLLAALGFNVVARTAVIPGFEHLMRPQNLAVLRLV